MVMMSFGAHVAACQLALPVRAIIYGPHVLPSGTDPWIRLLNFLLLLFPPLQPPHLHSDRSLDVT